MKDEQIDITHSGRDFMEAVTRSTLNRTPIVPLRMPSDYTDRSTSRTVIGRIETDSGYDELLRIIIYRLEAIEKLLERQAKGEAKQQQAGEVWKQ